MPGGPMLVEELTVAHDNISSRHSVAIEYIGVTVTCIQSAALANNCIGTDKAKLWGSWH